MVKIDLWIEFFNPPKGLKSWYSIPSIRILYPEIIDLDESLWIKWSLPLFDVSFFIQNGGWQNLPHCFHLETGDFDPDFKLMDEGQDYQKIGNFYVKKSPLQPGAVFNGVNDDLFIFKKLGEYEYLVSKL
ncbi:MAG TPA: hypothetical protein PK257_00410 [Candidatus Woesebacteria bacterium]|nr:hypothetical protein [Candidatus Woesebacteria bacterium]